MTILDLLAVRDPLVTDKIVIDENGCWLWTGHINQGGYGMLCRQGKVYSTHRYAYQLAVRKLQPDQHLDHLCRVRHCLNPQHLDVVTPEENQRRGMEAKEICANGHAWITKNIYTKKTGPLAGRGRYCRLCMRESGRRYRARKAAS